MKTIINTAINEIEIDKSKFIALLYKVNSIAEVKERLQQTKNIYKEATHYCYAYIIDDKRKASDDGEPSGTAGTPILEVLLKIDLNYILCIVVRYFGGIKLGAGGLVRAYTKTVSQAINSNNIIDLISGYEIEILTSYDNQKKVDYLLKKYQITKEYDNMIKYKVLIPKEDINTLNMEYHIIKEIYIEKK